MNPIKSCVFALIILPFSLFAQDGIRGTYTFSTYEPVQIPDSLSKESAIYIENVRTYTFEQMGVMKINFFKRIYINSKEAAEEYSKHEFYMFNSGALTVFNARKISNGEIIPLKKEHFIESYSNGKGNYDDVVLRRVQLIVPDLNEGDVLDIAYTLTFNRYHLSDLLHLEDDLTSLYSRISFRNESMLELKLFPFNGMSELKQGNNNGIISVYFEKKGVNPARNNYFNVPAPKTPGFTYTLWYPHQNLGYKEIYEAEINQNPEDYAPSQNLQKVLLSQGVINENEEKFVMLKKFLSYLENEFVWESDLAVTHFKSSQKYFGEKTINRMLYKRYLMKFLKDCQFTYHRAFTKSITDGQFAFDLISLEQLSDEFFVIYDQDNNPHFLFPPASKNTFYLLDEIPHYNEGNGAIILEGDANFFEKETRLTLPESTNGINVHKSLINVNVVDWDADSTEIDRIDRFKGHFSILSRGGNANNWFNSWNVHPSEKPTVSMDSYFPYEREVQTLTSQAALKFTRFNDSLVSFDISNLIPKGVYNENELDFKLHTYATLPFLKSEETSIVLKFVDPVIVDESLKETYFSNKVGSLKIVLTQMNPIMVKMKVTLNVDQRYLDESAIKDYEELLNQYTELRNRKWLFTIAQ